MTPLFATTKPRSRRGFTMTEILVVVGILVLLASIGVVVGSKAFKTADKVRLRAQLHTIESALDVYKTDFGSYPITDGFPVNNVSDEINRDGLRGARTLCKALVAPTPGLNLSNATRNPSYEDQDGKIGPGFRVVGRSGVPRYKGVALSEEEMQGKEYGPYLQANAVKWSKTNDDGSLDADKNYDDTSVLLDANGNVILYFPVLNSQPSMSALKGFIYTGPSASVRDSPLLPMYRSTDNDIFIARSDQISPRKEAQLMFQSLLGDTDGDGGINVPPNTGETAVVKGKPLLFSAGSDGLFGPNPGDKNKTNDDVTNFAD